MQVLNRSASDHIPVEEFKERMAKKGYVLQKDMAAALKISEAAISSWMRGKQGIPARVGPAIDGLPKKPKVQGVR